MKIKKILLSSLFTLIIMFTIFINLKPLYAAVGTNLNLSIPTDPTLIEDDFGQLSGITWTNDLTTGFNENGMWLVTVSNILDRPFHTKYSSFLTGDTEGDIFLIQNQLVEENGTYTFIIKTYENTTDATNTLTMKFVDQLGFSALKSGVTSADFNSTNISIRDYLGGTDDLYEFGYGKSILDYLDTTDFDKVTYTLESRVQTYLGLYKNNDLIAKPLATHGEWSQRTYILTDVMETALATDQYEGIWYNQTAGPTTWAEASTGDVMQFTAVNYNVGLDTFVKRPFVHEVKLVETVSGFNPSVKIGDEINHYAIGDTSVSYTNLPLDFDPATDISLADGLSAVTPQTYTFTSFEVTQAGLDATTDYLTTAGTYDATATFTGTDTLSYTVDFSIITDSSVLEIKATDPDGSVVLNNASININDVIVSNDTVSYQATLTTLADYLSFTFDVDSAIVPSSSYIVTDSNGLVVTDTAWYNTAGLYTVDYTYVFNGTNSENFVATYNVEVYDNVAPTITGPATYNVATDNDQFTEEYILDLLTITDDLDTDVELTSVITTAFIFTQEDFIEGDYAFDITVTDSHGLSSTHNLIVTIYEPLVPTNIFKIIMSASASIIFVLAGVFIYKKVIK